MLIYVLTGLTSGFVGFALGVYIHNSLVSKIAAEFAALRQAVPDIKKLV